MATAPSISSTTSGPLMKMDANETTTRIIYRILFPTTEQTLIGRCGAESAAPAYLASTHILYIFTPSCFSCYRYVVCHSTGITINACRLGIYRITLT